MLRPPLALALLVAPALAQTTDFAAPGLGGHAPDGPSGRGRITPDGHFVVFGSSATNLVPGDTNGLGDIFLVDRDPDGDGRFDGNDAVERVSVSTAGTQANGFNSRASVSDDGRIVCWQSRATNLVPGDTNGRDDVFVRDRLMGTTTLVSKNSAGEQAFYGASYPNLSGDGRFVVFESSSFNMLVGTTYYGPSAIWVHELATGVTDFGSVPLDRLYLGAGCFYPSISRDGRYVCFDSFGSFGLGDDNGRRDCYVRDRWTGAVRRVSVDSHGKERQWPSFYGAISADASAVVFVTYGALVPEDVNGELDTYVKDLATGVTERVSRATRDIEPDGHTNLPAISANGRYASFFSTSTNLVRHDAPGSDAFVWDRRRRISCLSVDADGFPVGGTNGYTAISDDGRWAVFDTFSSLIVPGDDNGTSDVVLHRRRRPGPRGATTSF